MFERFTDAARRVLVLAQEEARILNHNFIGTEHILLGLLHEGEGLAAQALAGLDVSLEDARAQIEATIGPTGITTGSPPFTPRAKKVLELSLREALQLGHDYIGTEHLLLGLVREGEGVAAQVLVNMGVEFAHVRQEVIKRLSGYPLTGPGPTGQGKTTAEARAVPRRPGPRCSRCRSELSESARYRTIDVPPDEAGTGEGSLRATLFYCSRCGALLAPPAPAGATAAAVEQSSPLVHASPAVRVRASTSAEPTRRFPDELLSPVKLDEVPEDARVELSYTDHRSIEGTVGASEVRLVGDVSSRRGPLKGTWGATTVYANWRLADMAKVSAGALPGLLSGRFGDDAFKLKGSLQLSSGYLLQRADISGELCGQDLRAQVYRAGGGLGSTDTVVAEGSLGQAGFQLFATISDDLRKALVRGSFDGQPVRLDATRDEPSPSVRVIGAFMAPPSMVALVAGALAHFL